MKLSKNLSLLEVTKSNTAIKKGIDNTPSTIAIENLKYLAENVFQKIRDHFKKPIYISSGFRSVSLNKKIGGSATSQHCTGEAIDIDQDNRNSKISNADVFYYILYNLNFDQLIWEFGTDKNPDWVHVSLKRIGKNRKQVLIAKKVDGKTIYYPYNK